jgi:hypothetical protein
MLLDAAANVDSDDNDEAGRYPAAVGESLAGMEVPARAGGRAQLVRDVIQPRYPGAWMALCESQYCYSGKTAAWLEPLLQYTNQAKHVRLEIPSAADVAAGLERVLKPGFSVERAVDELLSFRLPGRLYAWSFQEGCELDNLCKRADASVLPASEAELSRLIFLALNSRKPTEEEKSRLNSMTEKEKNEFHSNNNPNILTDGIACSALQKQVNGDAKAQAAAMERVQKKVQGCIVTRLGLQKLVDKKQRVMFDRDLKTQVDAAARAAAVKVVNLRNGLSVPAVGLARTTFGQVQRLVSALFQALQTPGPVPSGTSS